MYCPEQERLQASLFELWVPHSEEWLKVTHNLIWQWNSWTANSTPCSRIVFCGLEYQKMKPTCVFYCQSIKTYLKFFSIALRQKWSIFTASRSIDPGQHRSATCPLSMKLQVFGFFGVPELSVSSLRFVPELSGSALRFIPRKCSTCKINRKLFLFIW